MHTVRSSVLKCLHLSGPQTTSVVWTIGLNIAKVPRFKIPRSSVAVALICDQSFQIERLRGANLPFTIVRPKKCSSLIPRSSATRLKTSCPVDFGWSRWKDNRCSDNENFDCLDESQEDWLRRVTVNTDPHSDVQLVLVGEKNTNNSLLLSWSGHDVPKGKLIPRC